MKYTFGDIVVINNYEIGVVVKCWEKSFSGSGEPSYDVYIRLDNAIENYDESQIERYLVRHKYLSKREREYQNNALKT